MFCANFAFAQKQANQKKIVVSADPLSTESEVARGSYKKIIVTGTPLEQKQTVAEVLRTQPGVAIFNQGGPGKVSKLFLRGTNSEHTLVLVDGIEVNDPVSPGRAFDFAHTDLNNIESIEIIKGPQSVAYGSDALGGVVYVKTKKGEGPFQPLVFLEGGSFGSRKVSLGASAGESINKYSVMASYRAADGFSVANENDGNLEKDGYQQVDISSKWNRQVSERWDGEMVLRFVDAKSDLDRNGGPGTDDPNSSEEVNQFFGKLQLSSFLFQDKLETNFLFNYSQTYRKNKNRPDIADSTFENDTFNGQQFKVNANSILRWSESFSLLAGLEHELEVEKSNQFATSTSKTYAAYTQIKLDKNGFFTSLGARYDEQTESNSHSLTYQLQAGFQPQNRQLKVYSMVATGFKNPSLSQLYHPLFGNRNLNPEEVFSWELGARHSGFKNRWETQINYFDNDFKNLVSLDADTSRSINLGRSRIRGIEVSSKYLIGKKIEWSWGYSHFFQLENTDRNENLVRRPKNTWKSTLLISFNDSFNFSANYRYLGTRDDFQAVTFQRIKSPSFDVVDLNLDYRFKGGNQIFMKLDNLLNRDYEEIDGFGTAGLSFYTGLRLKL